jgi:hypothetical protein
VTVLASDITVVLSGGSNNSDPALSLGGSPSQQPVTTNLFPNVTQQQAADGRTDYRCVYVFNNSGTDTLYDTNIFVYSEAVGGADVELGVSMRTEVQRITINGASSIGGGGFDLDYSSATATSTVTVNWNASATVWGSNLQTALRTIPGLADVLVQVASTNDGNAVLFTIRFEGEADNRYHDILSTAADNLVGSASITISKIVNGSPVNAIDPAIESDVSTPPGVSFSAATADDPIAVGDLGPLDGVPVWVKREVDEDADAKQNDGFTLRVTGLPINS